MHRLTLLLLLLPALAWAAPDRAGLIAAWESAMRRDGTLEAQSDGRYHYRSESIGYDGGAKIVSAIVRADVAEDMGQPGVEAMGTVDFDFSDLPDTHRDSFAPGLMMWKAERQNFVYDAGKQSWRTTAEWAKDRYRGDEGHRHSTLRWMMDYIVPIGLLVLLVAVFLWLSRVQRQAKSQLAGSSEVNRLARENIERTAQLQKEQRAKMDESLELARRNAAALEAILEELRRRPLS